MIENTNQSVIIEEEAESPSKIIDSVPMSESEVEEEKTQIYPQERTNNQINTRNKAKQTSLTQQIDLARGRMLGGQQEMAN